MVLIGSKRDFEESEIQYSNCSGELQYMVAACHFLFNRTGASFNHSKPNRGIREHFFRTVVQSSK